MARKCSRKCWAIRMIGSRSSRKAQYCSARIDNYIHLRDSGVSIKFRRMKFFVDSRPLASPPSVICAKASRAGLLVKQAAQDAESQFQLRAEPQRVLGMVAISVVGIRMHEDR